MAIVTCLRKLPLMKILMTVSTGRIDGFEMTITMTSSTIYSLMFSGTFKTTETLVVESLNLPMLKAIMAAVTTRFGKLIVVHIGMTKGTLGECIVLCFAAGGMAAITWLLRMARGEVEPSHGMVETHP